MSHSHFLDIRTHGFLRVAIAVPRVHLADPSANRHSHESILQCAYAAGAQYVVCPELGLTGYSCGDLFHSETLLRSARAELVKLIVRSSEWPNVLFSVGVPLEVDGMVFNCAVTVLEGMAVAVAPKSYPPEYREFYEGRHFARASEAQSDNIPISHHSVPFGNDLLIEWEVLPDFVLHTEVCEDLWVPIPPSTRAALAGATVLGNLSASNIVIGKAEYRESLVEASSARNLAVQLYSAAGYGESTTDLAWDGDGYIAERGRVLARTKRFSGGSELAMTDVDLRSLKQDRIRQSSFRQNAADNPQTFRRVRCGRLPSVHELYSRQATLMRFRRDIDPHPFVPSDPKRRDERCQETFMIQATSLARRIDTLSHKRVIIGISGGQDSTHALLVAAHAMDRLGLPRKDIHCLTMPGFGTSTGTKSNAVALMEALGVTWREVSIETLSERIFENIEYAPSEHFDEETGHYSLTYENVQAWSRTFMLFAESCEKGIVLGTGDLSEMLLGWCTYAADHMSHYGVNAGVPKTLISHLIGWTSEVIYRDEPDVRNVLDAILTTDISPELQPLGSDGKIAQKTEEINGPYEVHDFFGYWFVRFGFPPSKIVRMSLHAFDGRYDVGQLKRWVRVFLTRFFRNQFKRSCLPDGPKVGLTAISPRGDWRMPSDARADAWLRELRENVPDTLD